MPTFFRPLLFILAVGALVHVHSALSQDYDIYVTDAGNFSTGPWQVLKFDAQGQNPEVFTTQVSWPQDILFLEDQGIALISNFNTNRINRHDADTGELIDTFASNLSQPTRMKIGPDGLLYVLQWSGSGTVKRYQLDGTPVSDFTSVEVNTSIGLDWDADGELYVSSFQDAVVRRFDEQGTDLGLFIETGLTGPTNLEFADDGTLLVLDYQGGAIRRFSAAGAFLENFTTSISQPEGFARLPSGQYLAGHGGTPGFGQPGGPGSVKLFESDGTFVSDIVELGAADLLQPNGVTVRLQEGTGSDGVAINYGMSGAWFEPETSGQGVFVDVVPDREIFTLAWFTFEQIGIDGKQAKVGAPEQRWYTAAGPYAGDTATLTLFLNSGGVFDQPDPVTTEPAGTVLMTFSSCGSATFEYAIDDGPTGQIPMQRVSPDVFCELLTEP